MPPVVVTDGLKGYWHYRKNYISAGYTRLSIQSIYDYTIDQLSNMTDPNIGTNISNQANTYEDLTFILGQRQGSEGWYLDGSNYLVLNNVSVPTGTVEIEMYVKPLIDSRAVGIYTLFSWVNRTTNAQTMVGITADGNYLVTSAGPVDFKLAPNTWYKVNIVINLDARKEKVYINGTLAATRPNTSIGSINQIRFGCDRNLNNKFQGSIASIKMYEKELSDAERAQNATVGTNIGIFIDGVIPNPVSSTATLDSSTQATIKAVRISNARTNPSASSTMKTRNFNVRRSPVTVSASTYISVRPTKIVKSSSPLSAGTTMRVRLYVVKPVSIKLSSSSTIMPRAYRVSKSPATLSASSTPKARAYRLVKTTSYLSAGSTLNTKTQTSVKISLQADSQLQDRYTSIHYAYANTSSSSSVDINTTVSVTIRLGASSSITARNTKVAVNRINFNFNISTSTRAFRTTIRSVPLSSVSNFSALPFVIRKSASNLTSTLVVIVRGEAHTIPAVHLTGVLVDRVSLRATIEDIMSSSGVVIDSVSLRGVIKGT